MVNGFPKRNKLCGKLRIAQLYKEGKRIVAWPLRVCWHYSEGETEVLVWAPKSLFKHAVDRNNLRRLMREAYRLNQGILGDKHYRIAFNYMDKELQSFSVIEKGMKKALTKIAEH